LANTARRAISSRPAPLKGKKSVTAPTDTLQKGTIVAAFGRHFHVELAKDMLDCVTRGRNQDVACGDRVEVQEIALGQGVIEAVATRSTLLYRSDAFKQKLIAANVTRIIFVLAPVPSYNEELLSRCLIAAEGAHVPVLVVVNKADLVAEMAQAMQDLAWVKKLGYDLISLAAKRSMAPLADHLNGNTSVLVGQSGMGKSTIINALVPDAQARVGDVSESLDAGKHTTTSARLYHLSKTSHIIDSPGLQEFGLFHLTDSELADALPEFRPYLGKCRFANCRHVNEPDCAVRAACASGGIRRPRLELYQRVLADNEEWRSRLKNTGRG
jgi:ribosome biogenesis GTPase